MREIFSDENKFLTWRKIWVSLAKAQYEAGLITKQELNDLEKNQKNLDIERILEIEKETNHDVVSAIREFAEKAKIGGKKIHLGATSQDIGDNAEILRDKQALELVREKLVQVIKIFGEKIEKYSELSCMGYTHLQPAEPTTLGYRFAFYAQDLLIDLDFLDYICKTIKGKGLKGADGTGASYTSLLYGKKTSADQLEKRFLALLDLEAVEISSQVYPRKFDYLILTVLNSISSSLAKFAFDLRIMQSPGFGEWQEPFSKNQVGSSAMPFKKNPLNSEKICSLARYINNLPPVLAENASNSLLERTLDDSANKRVILPEAFLVADEILKTSQKIILGILINEKKIKSNLDLYAPFSAVESVIIEAVKKGADRQEVHEHLRELSMKSWGRIQDGEINPMIEMLLKDAYLLRYLKSSEIENLLDVRGHIGDAPKRALRLVKIIRKL
ncbi:MAG: Adenylosuccinate lyase [Candidatus Daviesbacteria bacterium GW2011_GWB1_36_5]|uniref:Adenylosuccinate lyase n=1 Tax=Candidatus Daviesbacteria bacterium GW2011_GWB1_36_5 TaxID=1618426 RepID=A0A0G0FA78_9BACT|nr:MAG: Adenylosuccinate lyase [Candidatus Daviesbacteria bacterium GW2011_GWB1_36_5]